MAETEKLIQEVNASMAMEGMPLTDEDRARMRIALADLNTLDAIISSLVKKHAIKSNCR